MDDTDNLERIRRKIESAQQITAEDAKVLLNRIGELEKKNGVLSHHVLELSAELENVKMDFGGGSR